MGRAFRDVDPGDSDEQKSFSSMLRLSVPQHAILLLLALPWLNPFTLGPSTAVVPMMFAWSCAAVSLWVGPLMPRTIAMAWVAGALLSAVMALFQYFGATASFGGWVNSSAIGEAYGNLRQRNQFASLTNIGLAALLWWVASTEGGRTRLSLLLAAYIAVLLGLGNAASSSRTGMVQLILLCAWVWIWRQPRRRPEEVWLLAIAFFAYIAGAVLLPILASLDLDNAGMLARLRDGDRPCSSRLTLWSNVLDLIALKPLLGWGWGELDYAHFITLYSGERFCGILDNAHNLPLHIAVELGVPAALLFCGLCGFVVWRAKPWRVSDPNKQMAWAVLALIALHSMLEYPLWYGPFQIAAALSVWMIYGRSSSGILIFMRAVSVVVIALISYTAWDYWRVRQIYLPPEARADAYMENTLEKIKPSWLFKSQVRFAELSITPLTQENAQQQFDLGLTMLHYSPEAWVARRVIESAERLSLTEEEQWYRARFAAAFERPTQ
jgi:O-antigen ligase